MSNATIIKDDETPTEGPKLVPQPKVKSVKEKTIDDCPGMKSTSLQLKTCRKKLRRLNNTHNKLDSIIIEYKKHLEEVGKDLNGTNTKEKQSD
jgi:hypothetical protein